MKKLLIVEDDALMLKLYEAAFVGAGYVVDTAADGLVAWEKIVAGKPDGVLMDIMIPKLTGLEILDKLKADPAFKDMPVVMLTNLTAPKVVEEAQSKGARACLLKDRHTPKEMVDKVKELLFAP